MFLLLASLNVNIPQDVFKYADVEEKCIFSFLRNLCFTLICLLGFKIV
jgi:hypothetical protein